MHFTVFCSFLNKFWMGGGGEGGESAWEKWGGRVSGGE
jgi:hypothetical protein